MEYTCQNCEKEITESFCGKCGQKKFKRIDRKYISDELQYTLIHTNKGFMYSVKTILKNPGKTAREFIEGNRVNHYKPIGLAFILSGISTFISYKIIGLNKMMSNTSIIAGQNTTFMTEWMNTVQNYTSIMMLLFVPILALLSKIAFNDWRNNYYEHTVMNAFGFSYYTLLCIFIVYPIMYFTRHDADLSIKISMYMMLTLPLLMTYFYKHFYPKQTLKAIAIRVFLKIALLIVAYIGIIIVVVVFFILINGATGLKQFAPPPKQSMLTIFNISSNYFS